MNRLVVVLKSKTFWGAILGAGAWLAGQPHIGATEVLQAVGTVFSAAGLRDSIGKVHAQVTPTPSPDPESL